MHRIESKELRKVFADNVRALATRRGVPVGHVAELAGMSRSHLFEVLAQRSGATLEIVARLSEVLGVHPAHLLRCTARHIEAPARSAAHRSDAPTSARKG